MFNFKQYATCKLSRAFNNVLHVIIVPVDTGRKLNVHKTFIRRLLNVLCTFNLRPMSTGVRMIIPCAE